MRFGVSHSHFLGGPSGWTALDRDKAVWYEIYERERCPSCGTRPDEWDPDKGGHDHAYVGELHKCWGCHETAKIEKSAESKIKQAGPGTTVRLTRNPRAR